MNTFISISIPDITTTLQINAFHIEVVEPGWTYQSHYHHSFELLYCWDGNITQWLDGQPIFFNTGDWLLIPPGIKHKSKNHSASSFTYISFIFDIDDPDFRRELKQLSRSLVTYDDALQTQLPAYLHQLDQIIQAHMVSKEANTTFLQLAIHDRLALQAFILLMLKDVIWVLKNHQTKNKETNDVNAYQMDLANRLEQLLQDSLNTPNISVQDIYDKIGMSRSQGSKQFAKIFGTSPRQYITSQRLLQAKEKLIQTDQSIESIAEELGFASLSHFSRQFKKLTGVSPLNYRPKHQIR